MEISYFGKTPAVSKITVYTVIAGVDLKTENGEKILLFPQEPDGTKLGNLCVKIEPKARRNPRLSGKLDHFVQPLVAQVVIPLVAYSLKEKFKAESARIDPSETAFLIVPSGGQHSARTFHLKIACVIPIAFLPGLLGIGLNQAKELHWVNAGKILDGFPLAGEDDEEYLVKTVLKAYLGG
jgi:hypothetical protein